MIDDVLTDDAYDGEARLAAWVAGFFAQHSKGAVVRILDTETTGLDVTAEVIEIAIIDLDGKTLVNTLVKPQAEHIPVEASRVNGLHDRDVANAPSLPAVWPQIEEALRGATVIVYNAAFDSRLLAQSAARYGLSPDVLTLPERWECLMEAAAPVYGDGRWLRLVDLCNALGVGAGWHRALDDTQAVLRILKKLAAIDRQHRAERLLVAHEWCLAHCDVAGLTTHHHAECPALGIRVAK